MFILCLDTMLAKGIIDAYRNEIAFVVQRTVITKENVVHLFTPGSV